MLCYVWCLTTRTMRGTVDCILLINTFNQWMCCLLCVLWGVKGSCKKYIYIFRGFPTDNLVDKLSFLFPRSHVTTESPESYKVSGFTLKNFTFLQGEDLTRPTTPTVSQKPERVSLLWLKFILLGCLMIFIACKENFIMVIAISGMLSWAARSSMSNRKLIQLFKFIHS